MVIDDICEWLDVEVGEWWLGNDNFEYKFTQGGALLKKHDTLVPIPIEAKSGIHWILEGTLRAIWKPKQGETYFIPSLAYPRKEYELFKWYGNETNKMHFANGLVCKTKDEAERKKINMINFVRGKKRPTPSFGIEYQSVWVEEC